MSRKREEGAALLLVVILGLGLIVTSAVSVQMSLTHNVVVETQRLSLTARQIADSAAAQALARLKEGGFTEPVSGNGVNATWVNFSGGDFYYYTDYDAATDVSIVRAWGRLPTGLANPSGSTAAPDNIFWDGTGYQVAGVEVSLVGTRYIPEAPMYLGNGGIERPLGGFDWTSPGLDPNDPTTWTPGTSVSSYQSSSVPFQVNALDHPYDYLDNGGTPTPASTVPHPYKPWVSQTLIGQYNTRAWFTNSAGSSDPMTGVSPGASYYDNSSGSSPDYIFPVDSDIEDVQTFAWNLWSNYNSTGTNLSSGNHQGTYGTLSNPGVTFVTGSLKVKSGKTFKGAGILVVRDDYDPNYDLNNTPSKKAYMEIDGTFEWTGLVIVAGWAPTIRVDPGGDATIVGTLFGEDSVQSGGEISLDSATIIMRIRDNFRLLYSNQLFQPGGMVHNFMPGVERSVVGVREL